VHGRDVLRVRATDSAADVRVRRADALVAVDPGVAIGVRVADCVALLLFDSGSGAVAAVHAGWRGLVAGIIEAAAQALQPEARLRHEHVYAAIFPHIGRCCFEVGDEVAHSLRAASPDPDVVDRSRIKPHVDLRAIAIAQLNVVGLAASRIDALSGCTRCDLARFFSFRRDGRSSGHVAAIVSR
jgi:YfiH family protein